MAQVFSVNAVGYVNQAVPANGYAILSNPLNGNPDNNLDTTMALPDAYNGANIYRFNAATQRYYETMTFIAGFGWLAADDADKVINPGEGFFLQNVAGVPLNVTFVGEVPSGNTLNNIPGGNKYSIKSALVPKGGRLGWTGLAGSLEFPAENGDNVYVFNPATQRYKETYNYIDGLGWFHDVDPVEGPDVQPGTGFFVQKLGATRDWAMSFSVGN
jgi:hypothetical protein